MKRIPYLFLLVIPMLSACNLPEVKATKTAVAQTATAAMWTVTSLPTTTFTSTYTPTITFTPTSTPIPTNTYTPTITFTPTFAFPKVTVKVDNLACKFGPAKAYLWARDLHLGDTGFVWGRAPVGEWLYVKMDRLDIPCWIHPFYVDLVGNIKTMAVQDIWLPMTNDLYSAPKNVEAVRGGDQVTVTWDDVYMTQDDDRGYFLDVWVCQDGNYIWMPTSLPDQYQTSATFTDQLGCSEPSGGKLYTVEKHGYPDPVDIPWPPYD